MTRFCSKNRSSTSGLGNPFSSKSVKELDDVELGNGQFTLILQ